LLACGGDNSSVTSPIEEIETSTTSTDLPTINQLSANNDSIGHYEKLELTLAITAQYENPYDQRQVSLDAIFTAPDGNEFQVAGFWDAVNSWRVRFTPSQTGQWQYALTVQDSIGLSEETTGTFTVITSNNMGWLQQGSQVNSDYSAHYFVHHDGSPFYGIGHGDVFSIFSGAFDAEDLFRQMHKAKENYFVWWPQFYFSFISDNYDNYDLSALALIDEVVARTANEGLFMVFTLWDHSQLRDDSHDWLDGRWWSNGFRHLVSANDFFTDEEAWAWQKNGYRYIIARWGYSPAIAMWQTVSEVDGTNAFEQTDTWHEQVNTYFVEHDPYRHPITASKSGDRTWPAGHQVMDVPQVHIYNDLISTTSNGDITPLVVNSAEIIAQYSKNMWNKHNKPNWIGEFGVKNSRNNADKNYYPELFHHAIWSALANGAAMTPAEWNDYSTWGIMTPSMQQHMAALANFVIPMPLAQWNVQPLALNSSVSDVRAWGMAGKDAGFVWLQDYSLAGLTIGQIRAQSKQRSNITVTLLGLTPGRYQIMPYDTWQGKFLTSFELDCPTTNNGCAVPLPIFISDIALKFKKL
jgi:hypothetical protein